MPKLSDSESESSESNNCTTQNAMIMQIFASDDEGEFSGFSAQPETTESVAVEKSVPTKRKLNSVVTVPENSTISSMNLSKRSKTNSKSAETGPSGSGVAVSKKGKQLKPKKCTKVKTNKKDNNAMSREQKFMKLYDMLEAALEEANDKTDKSHVEPQPEAHVPEMPADVNNNVQEELEVDLSQFDNLFGDNDDDNRNDNDQEECFEYELPKIFEDDDRYGERTIDCIAKLINSVTKKKSDVSNIIKENKVPDNCKGLTPPKVNTEIWHILIRQGRQDDLMCQTIQRLIGLGASPIIRAAEILSRPKEALTKITDIRDLAQQALTILCNCFFEVSYLRRMLLKQNIDEKYHQLCTKNLEVTEYLFGDDMSKKVKDINDVEKIKGYVSTSKNGYGSRRGLGGGSRPWFSQFRSRFHHHPMRMPARGRGGRIARGRTQRGRPYHQRY